MAESGARAHRHGPDADEPAAISPGEPTDSADTADVGERLVRAAFEAFVEHGFEGAKVQDVARRAGVTTGAIYNRFGSKAALLAEAIGRHGGSFLGEALEGLQSGDDVPTTLRTLATLTQAGPPNPIHRVLTDACGVASRSDELRNALLPMLELVRAGMVAAIERAQAAGEIDPGLEPGAVVHLATTMMLGSFVSKALQLDQPSLGSAARLADRLVESVSPHECAQQP